MTVVPGGRRCQGRRGGNDLVCVDRVNVIVNRNRIGGPRSFFCNGFYHKGRNDLFGRRPLQNFPNSKVFENFTYYGLIFEEGFEYQPR